MIKVFIASDHAGISLKSKICDLLSQREYSGRFEVHNLGPDSTERVDYPDYADLVCKKIHGMSLIDTQNDTQSFPTDIGILICGSGQAMSMRANKYSHIRAALCWSTETAHLAREHNDANVLCLGERVIDADLALQIVREFINTPFAGGRHRQRLVKLSNPV